MQQQLKGQGYTESTGRLLKGTTIQYPGMGGGGAGVFVAGKLFISTVQPGLAASRKLHILLHVYI